MAILYAKLDLIPITKGCNKKTSIFWMYFLEMAVYSGVGELIFPWPDDMK